VIVLRGQWAGEYDLLIMVLPGTLFLGFELVRCYWHCNASYTSNDNMFFKCVFSGVQTYLHCEHVMHLVPGYGTALPVRVAAIALCCPRLHSTHGTVLCRLLVLPY